MTAKIINGRKIAKEINRSTHNRIELLESKYQKVPNIITIKIGNDPSSDLYLKLRNNACKKVGIISNSIEFSKKITENKILQEISKINRDKNVHGILIQLPLPNHISQNKLFNNIFPIKDVEGLNPYNMGNTLLGNERIVPCTPLSIISILDHEKINLTSKNVVIVNHSNVVGKPLSALLLNRNATVTICHVYTTDVKRYTSKADILVSATGIPKIIKADYVMNNSFVIDVGIVKTKDGICGDVDFDSVKEVVGRITPVPGGVGPITIACSLKNMLKTFEMCLEIKS